MGLTRSHGGGERLVRYIPALAWSRRYDRSDLRPDLIAGITVGAMLIPQGMAYAQLAGLPPEIGLYSTTLPVLVYALLGTSRQMAIGPVAVVSLLTAAALAPLAEEGSARYIGLAAALALLVGAFNLILWVARMGWVANLLSHSVLVGYTAAAAIIIVASQLKYLLGLRVPRTDGLIDTLRESGSSLSNTHMVSLLIGVSTLVVLIVLKRWKRTFPASLLAMVVGIAITKAFDLELRGLAVVGEIPAGFPGFSLPSFSDGALRSLLAPALTITLVGYTESVAVATLYARRNRYEIDPNQEFLALGAAGVAAGVLSGQPVTGSFTRTAVNAAAGARTALSSVFSALLLIAVLLFVTGLFTSLPQAILGAIVISAAVSLFELGEMRRITRVRRSDAVQMFVALAATLVFGLELGIVAGVAASLAVLLRRIMNPHTAELGWVAEAGVYRDIERFESAARADGVGILRFDVSLNFANVAFLKRRLRELCTDRPDPLHAIVIDATGINDIDASAEHALSELVDEYDRLGIALHLAGMKGPQLDVLARSGLLQRLHGRVHATINQAVAALTAG